jgi:hypothetical protein
MVRALRMPRAGRRLPLEHLVDEAAAQITRFSAPEAFAAASDDGLIVDIRSQDARELHGVVPGSAHIPRTVLEWRIALESPWRNVHLGGLDQREISQSRRAGLEIALFGQARGQSCGRTVGMGGAVPVAG